MMTRKRLFIIIGLVFFFVIILALATSSRNNGSVTQDTQDSTVASTSDRTVSISGLGGLDLDKTFNIFDNAQVGQMVYGFIAKQIDNPKDSYTGNVREGSYKTNTTDAITAGTLLVDLAELQRTVKVTFEHANDDSYNTIHVVCPDPGELVYKAVDCRELD